METLDDKKWFKCEKFSLVKENFTSLIFVNFRCLLVEATTEKFN